MMGIFSTDQTQSHARLQHILNEFGRGAITGEVCIQSIAEVTKSWAIDRKQFIMTIAGLLDKGNVDRAKKLADVLPKRPIRTWVGVFFGLSVLFIKLFMLVLIIAVCIFLYQWFFVA